MMIHQHRVSHGSNPFWTPNVEAVPVEDSNVEEAMQDTIALLDVLVKCLGSHPNSVAPHLIIQMTLRKEGIIPKIAHHINDLEEKVSLS